MIRLKTINVDGMEIERTFESVSEILKNWWDEEHGTDLPGGDDEVLELAIDGEPVSSPEHFEGVIHELEVIFWKGLQI